MAKNPQIFVEYIAKTEQLAKGTKDIEKQGAGLAGVMKKNMIPIAAALGGVSIAAKKAIGDASDLSEQINKTGVVFGKSGDALIKWSKGTARSLGISQKAALEATGTFGNMLTPLGVAPGKAAEMSRKMVTLAADMASFNNASPEETLDALRSGLAGEAEPLRRFGVSLSDARLRQEALRKGLDVGKGTLDAQTKAMLSFSLIMKDTAKAQGDFHRTSGGLANQQRILKAELENASASLGKLLLPILQAIVPIMAKFVDVLIPLAPILGPLALAIVGVVGAVKAWTAAQKLLGLAMEMNPWILAITAVILAIILLSKHWQAIKDVIVAVLKAIKDAFTVVFNWIRDHWKLILAILTGPVGLAVLAISKHWDKIKDGLGFVIGKLKGLWDGFVGFLGGIKDKIGSIIGAMLNVIKAPINALIGAWNAISFTIPKKHFPGLSIMGRTIIPDFDLGGWTIAVPKIPKLAAGGVVTRPTMAMIGEGRGSEIVAPESLLRSIVNDRPMQVRVFIGNQELRGLVRTEIVDANTGLARTLLTGARA